MLEWIREHIGEIALLIYIFYPLLKRWRDRQRAKAARTGKPAQTTTETRAPKPSRRRPAPAEPTPQSRPEPVTVEKRPTEADLAAGALAQAERLKQETSQLLARAEANPRLLRLVPALREDVLDRLESIERSLQKSPTLSTIVHETAALGNLDELLRYLKMMAQQRLFRSASFFAIADQIADDCYAPILDFARAEGLGLRTSQPVAVTGEWSPSILPRFASTRVAPLHVAASFEDSLWLWPPIAQEVARDLYYGVDGLERDLHARLGLPYQVSVPMSDIGLDGTWLRQLFGVWLAEIFADMIGTLLLGPASVEAMRRALRSPSTPQRTAAIQPTGGSIDPHPPARLRIYMAVRVLHHLGHHDEANTLWGQWEADHPEVRFYYLPLGGRWVGLGDEALHSLADAMIDALLQRAWPELDDFQLMSIPGFAYLHAEHARAKRLSELLAGGKTVDADARSIMIAAVLAASAQPTLHDQILEAAKRSIMAMGAPEREVQAPKARRLRPATIGEALVASFREPDAIREAIVVGATLNRYRRGR